VTTGLADARKPAQAGQRVAACCTCSASQTGHGDCVRDAASPADDLKKVLIDWLGRGRVAAPGWEENKPLDRDFFLFLRGGIFGA